MCVSSLGSSFSKDDFKISANGSNSIGGFLLVSQTFRTFLDEKKTERRIEQGKTKKWTNTEFHFWPMVEKIFHGTRFGLTSKLNCSKEEKTALSKFLRWFGRSRWCCWWWCCSPPVLEIGSPHHCAEPRLCVRVYTHYHQEEGERGARKRGGGGITSAKKIVKKNVCIKIVVA